MATKIRQHVVGIMPCFCVFCTPKVKFVRLTSAQSVRCHHLFHGCLQIADIEMEVAKWLVLLTNSLRLQCYQAVQYLLPPRRGDGRLVNQHKWNHVRPWMAVMVMQRTGFIADHIWQQLRALGDSHRSRN